MTIQHSVGMNAMSNGCSLLRLIDSLCMPYYY